MTATASTGRSRGGGTRPRAIGLVVHGGRATARAAAAEAVGLLHAAGVEVFGCVGDAWGADGPTCLEPEDFAAAVDVILVFGGDGTFLRAAYLARDCHVPLVGVDLGRLGFLSEIDAADVPAAVDRLIAGDFQVEERMTLTVEVRDAGGALLCTSWALNEASVERTVPQRLIVLEVRVGDTVFANVPADAVICATPTGSTAYAFSAHGPILSPLVDALLLVPVAPHSLFDRTLVVDPREPLWVRPVAGNNSCVVSLDGRESLQVPPGGSVCVSRGTQPVLLARLSAFDFWARVRGKFGLR